MDNGSKVVAMAIVEQQPQSTSLQFGDQTIRNFGNQVGGRAEIVSLNLGKDAAIGKPLNETELNFYETATNDLQNIIPCYKGVISVENGKPTDKAHWPPTDNSSKGNGKIKHYIVLEDITSQFALPSIMDLKMGSRQYSDTMSSDKIARKKLRSLTTTSHSMGLRVAGIRSYDNAEERYMDMDKLEGRKLTCRSVLDAFRMFLSNGRHIRQQTIVLFLNKLDNIITSIEMLNIRLYCCSLLLVYESDINHSPKVDIRIIDFAEFQRRNIDGEEYSEPDAGFLLGLNSLVHILNELIYESKGQDDKKSVSSEEGSCS